MSDHTHGLVYADDPDYKIAEGPFEPTWQSLQSFQCPEWFRDAKLGFWAHWGPQAVPMYGDWYARNMYLEGSDQYRFHWRTYGHPSKFGFKDVCAAWKAENFDPDALMQQYQRAGARYFVALIDVTINLINAMKAEGVNLRFFTAHRDVDPATDCPGDLFYKSSPFERIYRETGLAYVPSPLDWGLVYPWR